MTPEDAHLEAAAEVLLDISHDLIIAHQLLTSGGCDDTTSVLVGAAVSLSDMAADIGRYLRTKEQS